MIEVIIVSGIAGGIIGREWNKKVPDKLKVVAASILFWSTIL